MTLALDIPLPRPASGARRVVARQVDFHRLLGGPAWRSLPFAVQRRFGPNAHTVPVRYAGEMVVRASVFGWLIAQACRLLGTPLAPWTGEAVPVAVDVYTDTKGALVWDRTYAFERHGQVKVTSKKVLGRRGELMEVIHGGLGMTLSVTAEDGALHFRSIGYFLAPGGRLRLPIPGLLTPGRAHVVHEDLGGERFRFTLTFRHALAGETIFQTGVFIDPEHQP